MFIDPQTGENRNVRGRATAVSTVTRWRGRTMFIVEVETEYGGRTLTTQVMVDDGERRRFGLPFTPEMRKLAAMLKETV